ncbi:LysR family transcriptional regulator [Brucella pituitosa]|uniref:LysR family transcriptional regulator n=1 Tax=Brucella pituitosa TaxID=571256 RepID=UPI0020058649|nr:LysR family transcriptional regulator [Brucella pituitosa]MCK4206919.1 LysR family transcriptional regulator [Brucella pituitosa]
MRLTDLDLRLMQLFLTIVDNRGLSAAQTNLNLGLSTISSHLSTLENRLGVKLCERGRSGFRLTEEGEKVYQIARQLAGSVSTANSELASLRNILVGKLRIGTVDNVVNNPAAHIAEALHTFDLRKHEVSVTVEIISPRDLERQVSDGVLDIGIGPRIHNLGSLDYDFLFTEKQYLYCGRKHPLYDKAPDAWTDGHAALQKYASHICPLPDTPDYNVFRSASVAHNMESVAIFVVSGRFIGFLPEHYARQWVNTDMMRPIRPDLYIYENSFYSFRSKSQRANRLIGQYRRDLISEQKQGLAR